MQRLSKEEPPLNSLADILNKEVHVDEFADAFLRCLHDSTDGGLWDYLKQSSSSVESSQQASDPPSDNCIVVAYGSISSVPVNDTDNTEASVDLPEDVTSQDALCDDIVRLSDKQDEKTRATATAQSSHSEFPEVAGLEHAVTEAGRRHASLRTELRKATTDRDALKARLSVAEGEIGKAESRLERFRQLVSQRPQELRSVLAGGASFNEVFRRFSEDPNSLVDLYDWHEVVNSKLSVLQYFAKDVLSLQPFTAALRCMFEGCDFRKSFCRSNVRRAASQIPGQTLTHHVVSCHNKHLPSQRSQPCAEFSCNVCSPTRFFANRQTLMRHCCRRHSQGASTSGGHKGTLQPHKKAAKSVKHSGQRSVPDRHVNDRIGAQRQLAVTTANDRDFSCYRCSPTKYFATRRSLMRHRRRVHSQGGTASDEQGGTLARIICSSKFTSPELLSANLRRKHGMPNIGRQRSGVWSYFDEKFKHVQGKRTRVAYCKRCNARFHDNALRMEKHIQKCSNTEALLAFVPKVSRSDDTHSTSRGSAVSKPSRRQLVAA